MATMTLQFDDLLARTRAHCREAAREASIPQDRADAAWLDIHRHGQQRPEPRPITRTVREGETIKFTMQLADGHETESVILPMQGRTGRPRTTLCLSSQVGCALGCGFCETAAMGLVRNLEPAEILDQWHAARFRLDAKITNIVFMGMGEPMENLDAVLAAIEVLTDRSGAGIPASRISVSTAGRIAGIDRYREFMSRDDFRQLRLAVSVNAPNEPIRRDLMPITRAEPLEELRQAMNRWLQCGGRTILVEYVLIPGVNDADDHPAMLAAWLDGMDCRVNVIPYNPRRDSPWPAPDEAQVEQFIARLRDSGCHVNRRRTMGRDVMAACGQLGRPDIRRRVPLRIPS
ncbi:MAG: 23S rRNA (adenine(2503)-C(2))-methyltransferase RlmN [Phycisphaerales bacterium]|nr:23S rRNA (adenine(2503)-C(2))-methyltransferase RlmN [Phycisphaerales bacterium]